MASLAILRFPDPRLRIKSKPVTNVDGKIDALVEQMLEAMYKAPGIGLAAPQVNTDKNIIVIDISANKDQPLCFINPKIIHAQGTQLLAEGCLSIPGFFEEIERAASITVQAINRQGEPFSLEADGILAVCIQHEADHLQGRLFVDYISPLKRQRIRSKLVKSERQSNSA